MKLSFNLKGPSLLETIKKRMGLLLWMFLLLVLLAVGYNVYMEVRKVTQVSSDTSGITGQIVRVDLSKHSELSGRMEDNMRYVPQPIAGSDSFGPSPAPAANR